MNISVRLYASLAEAAGTRQVDLANVPEPATAGELGAAVFRLFPPLAALCQSVIYAVNAEYVQADYPVRAGDEVALIPPVSGGADPFFRISDQPLDIQTLHDLVRQPSAGAVALFVGVVRDTNLGRAVDHLEYDAYPAMAAKVMRRIADEARDRWEITAVAIHHRTGRLEIGEASVAIAVSSPHRTAAIEACQFAIDRLKRIAPIWKKEVWADGEQWIEGSPAPAEEARAAPAATPPLSGD